MEGGEEEAQGSIRGGRPGRGDGNSIVAAAQSIGFMDLFKRGHFIPEAKQGSDADSARLDTKRASARLAHRPCRTRSPRRLNTPAPWTRRRLFKAAAKRYSGDRFLKKSDSRGRRVKSHSAMRTVISLARWKAAKP